MTSHSAEKSVSFITQPRDFTHLLLALSHVVSYTRSCTSSFSPGSRRAVDRRVRSTAKSGCEALGLGWSKQEKNQTKQREFKAMEGPQLANICTQGQTGALRKQQRRVASHSSNEVDVTVSHGVTHTHTHTDQYQEKGEMHKLEEPLCGVMPS